MEEAPMPTAEARPRASRGSERARAMLEAATDIFIEKGYAAASLDDVIARAGGSRRTLYERFSNKEGLFKAVVEALIEDVLARVAALDTAELPLEDRLVAMGTTLVDALLQPRTVAAFRMVIAEIPRFAELGRAFYEAGPEAAYRRVAALLRVHAERGELALDDADLAARQLVELMKGDLHLRALMGADAPPSPAAIRRHVESAVSTFLRAATPAR